MKLIGLTGGIGAGKSTVASLLRDRGAHIVDADIMARRAVEPGTACLAKLAEVFGPEILDEDGSLNRAALGKKVFADERDRRILESIVHPEVQRLTLAEFEHWRTADPDGVVVYDVPLLAESSHTYRFDLIVVVHAPASLRETRLVEIRKMSRADAAARIAAQVSDDERLALADVVIDTSGTLENTEDQVDLLWRSLVAT